MAYSSDRQNRESAGVLGRIIGFCLDSKLVVVLVLFVVVGWGLMTAPFDWELGGLPRDPVPVDAIPDIGENQQIVFTEWMGRSPQDVEDQVTYPLTVSLLGVSGVKTVRSYSFFGFSSIYVIFKDDVEFYWSRSRVLEKLNSLPSGTLPEGVQATLGPDATALGQVYWYTLEGLDEEGSPTGGWDLDELRTIQDWQVRYALLGAEGISEVASIGGYVREYQIDVNPDAMRAHGIALSDIFNAVKMSNVDVGARSIEINQVEYLIRGLGFIRNVEDIEDSVIKAVNNVPVRIGDLAHVSLGPALRRGALDKEGAEAVGGVVVVRHGNNPLAGIKSVKKKIAEISGGLPEKVVMDWTAVSRSEVEAFAASGGFTAFSGAELNHDDWVSWIKQTPREDRPEWVAFSKVHIVPFYDRTGLIYETLGTLNTAIFQEILVTIIVVLILVRHLQSSVLISGLLPLAVLMTFVAMRTFNVDANIVALSGIAIAIGTMVDMGIVICENILRRLDENPGGAAIDTIYQASIEVGPAVMTAVATTVVGFLPVFAMEAAEGKLFKPLAFTKTFALIASILVALTLIPPLAHVLFTGRIRSRLLRRLFYAAIVITGAIIWVTLNGWIGAILVAGAMFKLVEPHSSAGVANGLHRCSTWMLILLFAVLLARNWVPLGPEKGALRNLAFVVGLMGSLLLVMYVFQRSYARLLGWALAHKVSFLLLPALLVAFGSMVWLGLGWLPPALRVWQPISVLAHAFPGLGKEFMPPLDEGSYLLMPTTMPHASIGEALDVLQKQDRAMTAIPELDSVVGKLGRAETPLDPAPISMFETVINYTSEFVIDRNGLRQRFRFDPGETDEFRDLAGRSLPAPDGAPYRVRGRFERDELGQLIPDRRGVPFRLWRPALDPELNPDRDAWPGIRRPDDIWAAILAAVALPGTTSAPKLQPIAARIVMLQSGMRAPMGVKIKGPDLDAIDRFGLEVERLLKQVPSVEPATVIADRIVGKPYLEIDINRKAIARYGIHVREVQDVIEVAIGGKRVTTTVEGRERYPVRIRYPRELRDQIETLGQILVAASDGAQIPLTHLAEIRYVKGPQVIKSEDTFLVGYVVFDKKPGYAEVDAVEQCQAYLNAGISDGDLHLPEGVSFTFAGSYQNQVRAEKKLAVVVPLALFIIFVLLYLQFRSALTAFMVFSGIFVAWAGGFIMIWLYGQEWFCDVAIFGTNLRDLFQMHPVNLSVAIWVGFLALFGIASDDGVLMATFLDQTFASREIRSIHDARQATIEGAQRRLRPALMTSATTILALTPILTSTGRGADIMIPMAIPSFGGMLVAMLTVFVVPILYCARQEWQIARAA